MEGSLKSHWKEERERERERVCMCVYAHIRFVYVCSAVYVLRIQMYMDVCTVNLENFVAKICS